MHSIIERHKVFDGPGDKILLLLVGESNLILGVLRTLTNPTKLISYLFVINKQIGNDLRKLGHRSRAPMHPGHPCEGASRIIREEQGGEELHHDPHCMGG